MEKKDYKAHCDYCGHDFFSRRKSAKYCCQAHRQAAYELRKHNNANQEMDKMPLQSPSSPSMPPQLPSNLPGTRVKHVPVPVTLDYKKLIASGTKGLLTWLFNPRNDPN